MDTSLTTATKQKIDLSKLEEALRAKLKGEVRFDDGSRALYATDGSNYRQVPIGVVIPRNEQDIIHTVAICRALKVPLLSRGGGTSLAGQCCNVALVMDMSKYYNQILAVNRGEKTATLQPGAVLDDLQHVAARYDLVFGPDPATHSHCTIGGMLGNNSCGIHSVMAAVEGTGARMSDNVIELDILTYDGYHMTVGPTDEETLQKIIDEGGRKGEIYKSLKGIRDKYAEKIKEKFPNIPRRVSGYNLDELLPENNFNVARALVGSEGTCVIILGARLKLLNNPKAHSLLVLGYKDVYTAGDHAPEIMKHKPVGLEGIDDELVDYMEKKGLNIKDLDLLPKGKGWLIVEFGGKNKKESDARAKEVMAILEKDKDAPNMKLYDDKDEEAKVWEIRESGLGATAFIPDQDDTWPGWEDSAVPPEKVGDYLRELKKLFKKYSYQAALYGHFGQGCIHCRIPFDLKTQEGIDKYNNFMQEASDLVLKFGGSLSGEHGDGQARGGLLEKMYGPELMEAFKEFKSIWDPANMMNPGKVVNPYKYTENLRLGADYDPAIPKTYFKFPEDDGDFSRAALRCVGVGKCRRKEDGIMCPSYKVTMEEKDATRGRARLLFEMLQGEELKGGWKNEYVKESLDLCLACKGCKDECPVNVDMATYKAEFLAHYYEGKLKPRAAYAFGLINKWSQLASIAPGVANFFTQTPGFKSVAKAVAGIAPERDIPPFANETFTQWFFRRPETINKDKPPVLLWTDTFNNYFHPETLKAATEVLEDAGYRVLVTRKRLCCGRPLYDFGMLDTATSYLKDILNTLQPLIQKGVPMVGIEPSCTAVFRDELHGMFPHDKDAMRLRKQTFTLAEFLMKEAKDYNPPTLNVKALVHGHCHHRSVMGMDKEQELLKKIGLKADMLADGCCGMAGSFGFEKGDRYDVSVKVGEQILLPAVRKAAKDTLIIANGFSCREQIIQGTDRKALHIAQVLQMAKERKDDDHVPAYPEDNYVTKVKVPKVKTSTLIAIGAGMVVLAAAGWLFKRTRN